MALSILGLALSYNKSTVRDFSETEKKRLINITREVNANEDIVDEVAEGFGRWLEKKGWLKLLLDAQGYQKKIVDLYNYDEIIIKRIFENARCLDDLYSSRVSKYKNILCDGVVLLEHLNACIDPASKMYTSDTPLEYRLQWFRESDISNRGNSGTLLDNLEKYTESVQIDKLSENEIVSLCFEQNIEDVFDGYYNFIYSDELKYGTLDATDQIEFQGVKISKEQIVSSVTSEKIIRENLNSLIDSVISSDMVCQAFVKNHDESKKFMLDIIKDFGSQQKESFEKNYPDYKYSDVEKFIKMCGGIDVVKKMAEDVPEWLDYLFNDYSNGIIILNSIENLAGTQLSPKMKSTVTELKKNYNNKWTGTINKIKDTGTEILIDKGKTELSSWIEEKIPPYDTLKTLTEMTGVKDVAEGYSKLLSSSIVVKDISISYKNAVKKIKSGEYDKNDITNVDSLFNMLKQAQISMFKTYRTMNESDPMKQIFANEQIQKLENMTMKDCMSNTFSGYYF